MASKIVYLSFDDGIQPGTMEVLRSLNNTGISATFFLTGLNTFYGCRRDMKMTLDAFKTLCENHIVGNHSFSHCHDFYSSYYTKGLLVDNDGKRLSVLEDFTRNVIFFKALLTKINNISQNVYERSVRTLSTLARLPGRNSWYYTQKGLDESNAKTIKATGIARCESDSLKVARKLYNSGYQIFGWDEEWRMSFDFYADGRIQKDRMIAISGIDYTKCDQVYIDFDMSLPENHLKDRLIDSWRDVAIKVENNRKDKVILLMHDRAFRSQDSQASKLENLIKYLQQQGVLFDTLDNY